MPDQFPNIQFLTFNTYGTWLHGDARGSVNRKGKFLRTKFLQPDPELEAANRRRMKHSTVLMDAKMRGCVRRAIEADCLRKQRKLLELNVRTNHVHVLIASVDPISKVLHSVKAAATRALREEGLIAKDQPVWGSGGDKRIIRSEEGIARVRKYIRDGQGGDLPDE